MPRSPKTSRSATPTKQTAPAPTLAEMRSDSHPYVFSRIDLQEMLGTQSKWIDQVDPLDFLSVDTVSRCMKDATRGAWAEIQWLWERLEPADAHLATCVDRRHTALKKIPWSIEKKADLSDIEDALADAQIRTVRDFCRAIDNMDDVICDFGQASFRTFRRVQMIDTGNKLSLFATDNWNWCRDGYRGEWRWNPRAVFGNTTGEALIVQESCILTRYCPRPIDQPAMMLCLDKKNAKAQWMCFNGRYGIPPFFVVLPAGTNPQTKESYIQMALQSISNSAGVLPPGADIKSASVQASTPDTFRGIIDQSVQELVLRATGGLMTMLTAPGAGTTTETGSAHQDAFDDLADSEAAEIAQVFNKGMISAILDQWHPGQPHLVEMVIKRPESDDTAASVANIAALAGAGYRTSDDQVGDLTSLIVTTVTPPPATMGGYGASINSAARRYAPTMLWPAAREVFTRAINARIQSYRDCNAAEKPAQETPSDGPLTSAELAALERLATPPTTAELALDAEAVKNALQAAIASPAQNDPQTTLPPVATPLQLPGIGNSDAPEEEAEADTNMSRSEAARHAANVRWGKESAKGDSKEPKTRGKQTNPFQAPKNSSEKKKIRALTKAIDRTSKKGGTVLKAIHKPEIGSLTVKGGSVGKKTNEFKGGSGTSHMLTKHGKEGLTAKKAATIAVKGQVGPNENSPSRKNITHKNGKIVVESELKTGSGRKNRKNSKLHTGYEENK